MHICRFYFAYCEAAFDAKYIHNFQVTWKKTGETTPLASANIESDGETPPSLLSREPADPVTQVNICCLCLKIDVLAAPAG